MRNPAVYTLSLITTGASLGAGAAPPRKPAVPRSQPALKLEQPNGLALDLQGNLYISDLGLHRVLKLDRDGRLTPLAGTGDGGYNSDGIPAAKARLHAPHDLAFDTAGNIYIADTYNHRIRRIDRSGMITTVAGNGRGTYAGDGAPALKAALNNPQGLAFGRDGSLFIADTYNHVVRRVDSAGKITTFAGSEPGLAGDGGPANRAQLSLPTAVAVAYDGAVVISDSGNNRIRRVRPDGIMETVLGTGPGSGTAGAGFGGDGGPAEKAKIFAAADVEVSPTGDLFLADTGNHRIRQITKGVIHTVAGTGTPGFSGDGGPAVNASLNAPQKLAFGPEGNLYITDRANGRMRCLGTDGRISTKHGKSGSTRGSQDPSRRQATPNRPQSPAAGGKT